MRRPAADEIATYCDQYGVTPDGRVAVKILFYTNLQDRLLGPRLAADQPPASAELRRALHVVDASVDQYVDAARMRPAA